MKLVLIVDGGTTNLRVTAVDPQGKVLARAEAPGGVRHTAVDGHNGRLKEALKRCIGQVLDSLGCKETDVERCIAFGMITSNMGLYELPHLIAPAGCRELHDGMKTAVFPEIAPFPVAFIPGVRNTAAPVDEQTCSRMDMMRGEETEAIGLYRLLQPGEACVFVLPGSHNKFVQLDEQGRILGCMTSISGELLDALTHHTILADSVEHSFCSAETYDCTFVLRGAAECMENGLGRTAFSGRILQTLGGQSAGQIQSWLLGAVLAEDVRALQRLIGSADALVYVAGKAPLQQAMCDVLLSCAGIRAVSVQPELSGRMGICGALAIQGNPQRFAAAFLEEEEYGQ